MKVIAKYRNGNYNVTIFDDGTKIRENDLDFFEADRPESMDCKITNQCPFMCPQCHEKSTPDGKHGDIMNVKFIDNLQPGTEMAIGGGAVTSHPQLVPFLRKLKRLGVIPSITVQQLEYQQNVHVIEPLMVEKLIYGLGVSYKTKDDAFWDVVLNNPNVVVHLIAGYHSRDVFEYFANKNAKVLVLGYKNFGRGAELIKQIPMTIKEGIEDLKYYLKYNKEKFKVLSFDNLAIEQLDVKKLLSDEQWQEFYQGDDGTHTMYVDLVKEQFARTSTSKKRYSLTDDIVDMFNVIKNESVK